MNFSDLFWIVFAFMALQPVLQKRFLENMRQRKIAEIESQRGSRVILLVHRQETMSFLGFPIMRYIDINDSEAVLSAIKLTDDEVPLDIILHTPGGLVLAATQIARAIEAHPAKVTVFVPHLAMSGGTLIALAADEIVLCDYSALGPIDPQLGGRPAASLIKVAEQKADKDVEDETLMLADIGRKAIAQIEETAFRLLKDKMPPEKAREIARMLSEGRWTHDYPIFAEEARQIGLPVSTEMPDSVLSMMALYPQPVKTIPSVEYLPDPRPAPGRQKP